MSSSHPHLESEDMESLIDSVGEDALFPFSNMESLFATLEEPYEELECRITVSSMVQEAVSKGFLRALEEEARTKDMEIVQLRELVQEKDATIFKLRQRENNLVPCCEAEDVWSSRKLQQLWFFVHESHKKSAIEEKEKEMVKLAANMVEMAAMLDYESKGGGFLDKQLGESRDQDQKRAYEASALQEDVKGLKVDAARSKRHAQLEDETMQFQIDRPLKLGEKDSVIYDVQKKFFNLQAKLDTVIEKLNRSLLSNLHLEKQMEEERATHEEEKMMQQVERDVICLLLEQEMCDAKTKLAKSFEAKPYVNEIQETEFTDWEYVEKLSGALESQKLQVDIEGIIIETIVGFWCTEVVEVLQGMTAELLWKDVYHGREVTSLKQAAEEWENDYTTLMSICLTLIRDQEDPLEENSGQLVHVVDYGRQKLIELSGILNVREVFIGGQRDKFGPVADVDEENVGQQLQHEFELEVVSEVCKQKFEQVIELLEHLHFALCCEKHDKLEASGEASLLRLEIQMESVMELEARGLERMKSGCSASITGSESKFDKLMKMLVDQVNERKSNISHFQETIKQQEWKYNIENEIVVALLLDAFEQVKSWAMPPKPYSTYSCHSESEQESHQPHQSLRSCRNQDKDKVICFLKRENEELRKEKAVSEHKLDELTEELYSLKRLFWKEKEVWMSKLTYQQRKEIESLSRHSSSKVELEEEFKKLEDMRFNSFVSNIREEWNSEKAGLLQIIQLKEVEVEELGAKIAENNSHTSKLKADFADAIQRKDMEMEHLVNEIDRLDEQEKEYMMVEACLRKMINQKEVEAECLAAEVTRLSEKESTSVAKLLSQIGDLEIEKDNCERELLNKKFLLAKANQEWRLEKEGLSKKLALLLEKEQNHTATEARLLACVTELEKERENVKSEQNAEMLKCKQEWEGEKEYLLAEVSEMQEALEDATSRLYEKEELCNKKIEQLEIEKSKLIAAERCKKPSESPLMEGKELALALAIKEREEEEKRRKILEIQLQSLKLEVKNLQGLNEEVAFLKSNLELVPRQVELKFAEKINQFMKACDDLEHRAVQMVQERLTSLDSIKESCRLLKGPVKAFAGREAQYKQRLSKEASNLQKAETEVDLLGDEVDVLWAVLEEVHETFEIYMPILQYHPKIMQVAKLVKQEIELRIDPKHGV